MEFDLIGVIWVVLCVALVYSPCFCVYLELWAVLHVQMLLLRVYVTGGFTMLLLSVTHQGQE